MCVWSSSLGYANEKNEGNIILLGDAAHGMWPSLGQGANCALESVAIFVQCLENLERDSESNKDMIATTSWTKELVQRFNDARHEDAVAAVDLTYGGIGARESRGRASMPLAFKLQVIGMLLLHKLTFGLIPMPALFRIMSGSTDLSYSEARTLHFHEEKNICLSALSFFIVILIVGIKILLSSSGASAEL